MKPINRKVITLCGSTKFKDAYNFWNKYLTLAEKAAVFSVAWLGHSADNPPTVDEKTLLDQIHKDKILLSDMIFVLDVRGYIGQSTRSEIAFAKDQGVPVVYMSEYVVAIKPGDRPDELNGSKIMKNGELVGWFLPQQREKFANSREEYTEIEMPWGQFKREQNLKFDPVTKEIVQ